MPSMPLVYYSLRLIEIFDQTYIEKIIMFIHMMFSTLVSCARTEMTLPQLNNCSYLQNIYVMSCPITLFLLRCSIFFIVCLLILWVAMGCVMRKFIFCVHCIHD